MSSKRIQIALERSKRFGILTYKQTASAIDEIAGDPQALHVTILVATRGRGQHYPDRTGCDTEYDLCHLKQISSHPSQIPYHHTPNPEGRARLPKALTRTRNTSAPGKCGNTELPYV